MTLHYYLLPQKERVLMNALLMKLSASAQDWHLNARSEVSCQSSLRGVRMGCQYWPVSINDYLWPFFFFSLSLIIVNGQRRIHWNALWYLKLNKNVTFVKLYGKYCVIILPPFWILSFRFVFCLEFSFYVVRS